MYFPSSLVQHHINYPAHTLLLILEDTIVGTAWLKYCTFKTTKLCSLL